MKLPYVADPPLNLSEEDEAVVQRVRARRGEKGLLPLDLALLHAPKVADGMFSSFPRSPRGCRSKTGGDTLASHSFLDIEGNDHGGVGGRDSGGPGDDEMDCGCHCGQRRYHARSTTMTANHQRLEKTMLTGSRTGWNAYLGAIRTRTSLPDNIREIAILRPALINRAWFEWNSHLPIFQASEAYTPDKLQIVSSVNPSFQGGLTDREWLVLRYADAMTKDVQVPQELFDELREAGKFSEQEVVEITATIAAYNMVSRFLVALDIGEANGKVPKDVQAQLSN